MAFLLKAISTLPIVAITGSPGECLERSFKFKNFSQALEFANKVGAAAEEEDHHPLIVTEWGRVTLQWWTHTIGGLHKNDFIMAAKTDEISNESQ